ncbi:hypothetical protein HYQ46_005932 [Verticillium longisporum]|nr:hypothetical protein HYQ46_005932 [Verticillium longisporum]
MVTGERDDCRVARHCKRCVAPRFACGRTDDSMIGSKMRSLEALIRSPRATVVQFLRDVLQARPGCVLVVDGLNECTAPADSSSFITRFLEDDKNANTPATRVVPDVYDLIRPKWETTQDQVAPRATVVQLLRDVLQARPGCILGVDVLDECTAPADSSSSITRFLEDVKNAITPATRVLVNCRDEPEIRQTLRANDSYSLAKYQISPRDVHDDASAFSRSIVDRKLANKPEDIRASLSKTITDRSDCQFLWLLLQEQSLKSWKTLVQLRRGLDSTPAGLNNLYERNWTKITRSN